MLRPQSQGAELGLELSSMVSMSEPPALHCAAPGPGGDTSVASGFSELKTRMAKPDVVTVQHGGLWGHAFKMGPIWSTEGLATRREPVCPCGGWHFSVQGSSAHLGTWLTAPEALAKI